MAERYSRQIFFSGIGEEGQKKLGAGTAVIIGCGALGSIIASALVRAGVGKVRIIDRDFIELHNLQRQVLFDEEDIRNELPKAVAAERHLKKVNSAIEIEGIVADVNFTNVERLVSGADVILDGLDNFETRFLINDVSLKHRIPWVYGSATASSGMMKVVIPHETACFRCLMKDIPPSGTILTCDTAGVVSAAPLVIGSLQTVEALKILIASDEVEKDWILMDVWAGSFERLRYSQNPDCPSCRGEYEFLAGKFEIVATSLCGQNAVQVRNPRVEKVSFGDLEKRLGSLGEVSHNEFMLHFKSGNYEMVIFPDGRAIIKNTDDPALARAMYSKFIGT